MASIGQELLNVPFPQMVQSMGLAIAQAQHSLDMNSVRMAQVMSGAPWIDEDGEGNPVMREGVKVAFGGKLLSLLELGFTPTFYQFVDTIIEVKISISMRSETEQKTSSSSTRVDASASLSFWSGSASCSSTVSTVSASFAARNSYSAEGASLLRTKIVPLPPPAVLQERIRGLLQEQKGREIELDPSVVEVAVGESVEVTVPGDVGSPAATVSKTGVIEEPRVSEGKMTVTGSAEGVVTITVKGVRGTESQKVKGEVKVLVRRAEED